MLIQARREATKRSAATASRKNVGIMMVMLLLVLVNCSTQFQFLTFFAGTITTMAGLDPPSVVAKVASPQSSDAASQRKQVERMDMYRERYNYHPPVPDENYSRRSKICGTNPDYDTFFALPNLQRSANHEDWKIYNLFFKPSTNSGDDDNGVAGSVVELGAFNGIQESNSRFFELCLGWPTLLIEGQPNNWKQLVKNRPHAHRFSFAPTCSDSDDNNNKTVQFQNYAETNSGLASVQTAYSQKNNTVNVPCGSLTQILLDVFPNGHVTFFSLDVEGSEPSVVGNAIDFDRVFIEVMIIENYNNFCERKCKSRDKYRQIMKEAGYVRFENVVSKSDLFVHPLSQYLQRLNKMESAQQ